jgi:hypothetical protein
MTVMSELPESINSHSLNDPKIYHPKLKESIDIILQKYISLIEDYQNLFFENIKISNEKYYKYLLLNGIKTISTVFLFILMYTRSLPTTYFHTEKSYYIYIEFVSQIDNQNHSFLQLNGKDASLFVYKKTIFEIDNNIKKDFVCKEKEKLDIISNFYGILLKLYNYNLEDEEFNCLEDYKSNLQKINQINFNILTQIVNLFSLKSFSQENNIKYSKLVLLFIDLFISHLIIYLKENKSSFEKIEIYLEILFNKLRKNKINEENLKQLNQSNIKEIINKTPKKFIDNLIDIN